jgi:hypothetical protein
MGEKAIRMLTSKTSTKHVVYLHGATKQLDGYSAPWAEALKPYLYPWNVPSVEFHEINYSDLMSPWTPDWWVRMRRWVWDYPPWVTPFGIELADDIGRWPSLRQRVIERVLETLLLYSPEDTTVICHSFGTIVMPEVLWALEEVSTSLLFNGLIMCGGSLGISPVVKAMTAGKPEGWSIHRPTNVRMIQNLGVEGDPFAGPLPISLWKPNSIDEDIMGIRLYGSRSIPEAHADYFNPKNVEVIRHMVRVFEILMITVVFTLIGVALEALAGRWMWK